MEPSAVEIRVLGALIEKQRTTPDAYPLTLNSLRLACNQSTNRDPVVDYGEAIIRDALAHLRRRGWAKFASGPGSRSAKYRHLLDEALGLSGAEVALLCVLMLRGAQTPGELKQRADRLHSFADLGEVQATLDALAGRELVANLGRRPGQKEDRWEQLLGGSGGDGAVAADPAAAAPPEPVAPAAADDSPAAGLVAEADSSPELERRIGELEAAVAGLREELAALRRELGA